MLHDGKLHEVAHHRIRSYALYDLGQSSTKLFVAKLDANGDGVVTKEELAAFLSEVQKATPLKRPSKVGIAAATSSAAPVAADKPEPEVSPTVRSAFPLTPKGSTARVKPPAGVPPGM